MKTFRLSLLLICLGSVICIGAGCATCSNTSDRAYSATTDQDGLIILSKATSEDDKTLWQKTADGILSIAGPFLYGFCAGNPSFTVGK